ncbi:hypothetical protein HDE_04706 [Halotydeus destructor]|nr:hypothetical protein HDE_04706 [Halotydeus destructor]
MDLESSSKKTGCYHSITNGHTEAGNSASSSSVRNRSSSQSSFIHDSLSSSLLETYIPWQTLSTDVTDLLRLGSVKINKSNRLEWAQTIKEEVERAPLLDKTGQSSSSGSTSAISAIRNKNIAKTVQQVPSDD